MTTRMVPGAVLVLALIGAGSTLRAQTALPLLRPRAVAGGLSVGLPDSWRPLDGASQAQVLRVLDTMLQNTADSVLKAGLRNGTPVTLLIEYDPANRQANLSVNAAPAPGITREAFGSIPADQVATALAPVCSALRAMVSQARLQTISCGPTEVLDVGGRVIALTTMVRSGPAGRMTVRLAQFPEQDVVYTVTLTSPQDADTEYGALFAAIYGSVTLPR